MPKDELITFDGLAYKFGRFGFIYSWFNGEWHRTTTDEIGLLNAWKRRFRRLVPIIKASAVEGRVRQQKRLDANQEKQNALMQPYVDSGEWKTMGAAESRFAAHKGVF